MKQFQAIPKVAPLLLLSKNLYFVKWFVMSACQSYLKYTHYILWANIEGREIPFNLVLLNLFKWEEHFNHRHLGFMADLFANYAKEMFVSLDLPFGKEFHFYLSYSLLLNQYVHRKITSKRHKLLKIILTFCKSADNSNITFEQYGGVGGI